MLQDKNSNFYFVTNKGTATNQRLLATDNNGQVSQNDFLQVMHMVYSFLCFSGLTR